jgi:hypothetical protein
VPAAQTTQAVPFQFPVEQTQEFRGKLQTREAVQVAQTRPFQLEPEGQPHEELAAFQLWPEAQLIQANPFQFWATGQTQFKVFEFHDCPPAQAMQLAPFQF